MLDPQLVLLEKLKYYCNPFDGCCWSGLDTPITKEEVMEAVEKEQFSEPEEYENNIEFDRADHVKRIAWFVVHGWTDPIGIDVGVPSLGAIPKWAVIDGNHRYAAAIIRGQNTILASLSGDVSELEQLIT